MQPDSATRLYAEHGAPERRSALCGGGISVGGSDAQAKGLPRVQGSCGSSSRLLGVQRSAILSRWLCRRCGTRYRFADWGDNEELSG
jgi:hypothetical protein